MQTIIEHIEEVAGNLIKKLELAFSSDVKALEARVAAIEAKLLPKEAPAPVAPVKTPETK